MTVREYLKMCHLDPEQVLETEIGKRVSLRSPGDPIFVTASSSISLGEGITVTLEIARLS